MTNDKRIKRTRQLLRQSLLDLLREKRFDEISVQDIIDQAGVARSTFYAHYIDKEDLLVGSQGVFAREMERNPEFRKLHNTKCEGIISTCFWQNILAHRAIFDLIARDPAMDVTMKDLYVKLQALIRQKLQSKQSEVAVIPPSLVVEQLAGSIITLVKWWVKEGMTHSPEQMHEIFRQISFPMLNPEQNSQVLAIA